MAIAMGISFWHSEYKMRFSLQKLLTANNFSASRRLIFALITGYDMKRMNIKMQMPILEIS
jgi:hypothetical protein